MAAELQQSPESPSQRPPLQNLAPLKPLLDLKRGGKKPATYLCGALLEKFKHFHAKDRDVFREIGNVGQKVSLYFNGNQFLVRSPVDGTWGFLPTSQGNNVQATNRALNVMLNIKQNLLGKWEGSSPDILVRAVPTKGDRSISAAKAADAIVDYYERQFYHTHFSQQEALMGMTFGTYIDRYRYDDQKVSMKVLHDIFETREVSMGDGVGFCGDCTHGGTAAEFTSQLGGDGPLAQDRCPQCGSTSVKVVQAAGGAMPMVVGQEAKTHGDLTCELLPMPACRWDLSKRPEESNWFIYRQQIPKGAITRVMGNIVLPDSGKDTDHGLEVLRALGHEGAALSGYSNYGNNRKRRDEDEGSTFDEFWMSPDDYADVNLRGDEETVEGGTIPKGKLTDVFPDGLCAVGLDGMTTILALYPEQHKKHIVSGTWFMQAQTGAGRGLADSVEIQDQFNYMNNQAGAYMTATYTPAIGYDSQLISGSKMKYIGTPKTNIPFDLTKLPEGRSLKDAIFQFQPTAMPNQFFNYAQNFLNTMFQKTSMVTDFANGEPGLTATNTTATAAEIDQGNADAINQPIFLIKADARKRGAEITINLFREHFPMKRYFDLGGEYGQEQGIELSSADVDADFIFEVIKNSEMPKGPFTKQKNRQQFFAAVGGLEGLAMGMQAFPKLVESAARDYDVDLEIGNDYDGVNELCLRRLSQMKQALKVGVEDPRILIQSIQPPISAVELHLQDMAKWFARWLTTDEGLDSPMPLRAASELLAQGMYQGGVAQDSQVAMGDGTIQAAQMAPAALGQAQLEAQAQQPESNEPDATAVLQMQQELSQQQHEAKEGAADRDHELQIIKAEGERDKDVSTHDAKEKIKIERAKPRPKPAVKAVAKK